MERQENSQIELKEKINSLQALRLFLLLGIMFGHFGMRFSWAFFGVSAFFVLSGFVLTFSYYEKECGEYISFALKPIRKLYLLHILTTLAIVPLAIIKSGFAIRKLCSLAISFFLDLTLLQSWIPHKDLRIAESINDVSWFFSATVFMYFLFPIMIKLLRRIKKIFVLFLLLLACVMIQGLTAYFLHFIVPADSSLFEWATYRLPIFRLMDFGAGCLGGCIYLKIKAFNWNQYIITALELVSIAFVPVTIKMIIILSNYDSCSWIANRSTLYVLPASF